MPCCLCGSQEHTSPHCRWINIYRDKNGKFRCSEIGFETKAAAVQVGEEHGDTFLGPVHVEWSEWWT
ncbi:hypothetical protein ACPCHQ_16915 [Ralstonia thomasii]|jgi:hypothetical protein|uniref:Uncharacterized protein n=1 Tax=Ralstonia pickettii (strain 12J) TaxID=402626 RepID=B2U8I0_RALPJ|nr:MULTISPECIES: hypothetical protein [Ralstonia]MBT2177768.1 hypothetical protein [Ralstonia pickettii]CAJ0710653.1 hypothetical protein LMG7143_01668 [Ralstonia sp. LMG 18095]